MNTTNYSNATTSNRVAYWTDGQSDMALIDGESEQFSHCTDAELIEHAEEVLIENGGQIGEGKIKVGKYTY